MEIMRKVAGKFSKVDEIQAALASAFCVCVCVCMCCAVGVWDMYVCTRFTRLLPPHTHADMLVMGARESHKSPFTHPTTTPQKKHSAGVRLRGHGGGGAHLVGDERAGAGPVPRRDLPARGAKRPTPVTSVCACFVSAYRVNVCIWKNAATDPPVPHPTVRERTNRSCGGPSGWCARWRTLRASTRRAGRAWHDS